MSDTNSAPVLSDGRLAILAVNPTEANNALGKEVRAMALELQRRRASDPIRAELLEALKPFADLGVGEGPDDEVDAAPYRILRGAIRKARAAITRAEE